PRPAAGGIRALCSDTSTPMRRRCVRWWSLIAHAGGRGSNCGAPLTANRRVNAGGSARETRSPTAHVATSGSELPLLGSNQDSPDPMPLRLSPPPDLPSVRGLDCAFTFALYAVRWLPPSLYTFPVGGLARRCQLRVRRLR